MMVPAKSEPVWIVAELPTCQKRLQAWSATGAGSLMKTTELYVAVLSADPTWKIQVASGLPSAFRVSAPSTPSVVEAV
jgi:hypothetical protein